MDNFECTIRVDITRNGAPESETPFFDSEVNYHNLSYEGVVAVEKELIAALERLNQLGEQKSKEKKGK